MAGITTTQGARTVDVSALTRTSLATGPHRPPVPIDACGHCGFAPCDSPAQLSRTLSRIAVGYERAVWAAYTAGLPEDATHSLLDQVVHVRNAHHGYANRLDRLADIDNPVFADFDPEPIQPVALDYTWAAVTGLVANIHRLAATIDGFPADRWHHRAVLHGRSLTALELANYGVHEAIHHLYDIELLAPPAHNRDAPTDHHGPQPPMRPADNLPRRPRQKRTSDVGA